MLCRDGACSVWYAPYSITKPALSCRGRRMMLLPVDSVAPAVKRHLGENEFGGQPELGQVGGDSLLRRFRRHLRIEEDQHRGASSAQGSAQDAGSSSQFLERGQQR